MKIAHQSTDKQKILEIAKYILLLNERFSQRSQNGIDMSEQDAPDEISNLKLLKLVYYANALSLIYLHTPLFDEKIEAWRHGPVVPSLYRELKKYKGKNLMNIQELRTDTYRYLNDNEKHIITMAFREYGRYTAFRLRDMTHTESPWVDSFQEGAHNVISDEKIIDFFAKKQQEKAQYLYQKSEDYICLFR